jgi:TolB protein
MRRLALFMLAIMLMLASLVSWPEFSARLQPQSAAASVPSPSPTPTATAQPTPAPSAIPIAHTDLSPARASILDRGLIILALGEGLHTHLFTFQPSASPPFMRLTAGDWDDISPAISPDGTRLAFASNREGPWDLFIMDLSSGKISRLTDTPGYEASPSWSPDGRWLAYEAYVDGNGGGLDIYILSLDGDQSPIRLTGDQSPSGISAADYAPAWSPQGRQVAFVSTRSGEREIWLADLNQVTDRFRNISHNPSSAEAHPAWSPDGQQLAWATRSSDGVQSVCIWKVVGKTTQLQGAPRCIGSGDWPVWEPSGLALLTVLSTPNRHYLTSYDSQQGDLILPPLLLSGSLEGLTWGAAVLPEAAFQEAGIAEAISAPIPTTLWLPALSGDGPLPSGRQRIVPLKGVEAPMPLLQDLVDESFQALRARLAAAAGWDFLSSLENAYVPLTAPLDPGMGEDWLYTGRAFAFNTLPINATWVVVAPEPFGSQTYWRVYVKTRFQDGSQGSPLHDQPWDFNARYAGNPHSYEQGGLPAATIPPGYWLDFTRLAEAYGWERLPALSTWRSSYPAARFNEFALTDQLDWQSAMLEVYPAEALITPTPITPTPEPSRTARPPTSTATPTRTPWRVSSPTPTSTP